MKKVVSSSLLCLGAAPPAAVLAKAEPDCTLTANVTLASASIYRGIAQTNNRPAIQGGFDFARKGGIYLGNWNSKISRLADGVNDRSAPVGMDFHGGCKAGGTYGRDGGLTLGAYCSDTNAAKACFTGPVGGKNLGDGRFLVTAGRSF